MMVGEGAYSTLFMIVNIKVLDGLLRPLKSRGRFYIGTGKVVVHKGTTYSHVVQLVLQVSELIGHI